LGGEGGSADVYGHAGKGNRAQRGSDSTQDSRFPRQRASARTWLPCREIPRDGIRQALSPGAHRSRRPRRSDRRPSGGCRRGESGMKYRPRPCSSRSVLFQRDDSPAMSARGSAYGDEASSTRTWSSSMTRAVSRSGAGMAQSRMGAEVCLSELIRVMHVTARLCRDPPGPMTGLTGTACQSRAMNSADSTMSAS
jgi:hypothetical protein